MQIKIDKSLTKLIGGGAVLLGSLVSNAVLGFKVSKEKKENEELKKRLRELNEELNMTDCYMVDDDTIGYLLDNGLATKCDENSKCENTGE